MITEHRVTVQRTARYYTLGASAETSDRPGTLSKQTRRIWFVLHGYGQLAQYFIRRFDVVANNETLIVAPEGLSRLYTDQQSGKVGASWLTREDRDNEVIDYVAYLDQVLASVLGEHSLDGLEVTLMGFSQGASTVCRWLDNSRQIRADRLILWAGYFPNGLSDILSPKTIIDLPVAYVYGDQDEYISQLSDIGQYLNRLKTDVPQLELIPFHGRHVVNRDVLKTLVDRH
ncbi:alpha/beta hydrolase [Fibrella forsythiae]|uniref:Phospholipase n=1 Tax=Fibrella forsythiae TaxID=2817061 RepID=A0ABS3JN23_9BACT|nr:phospholipase [Fibrella forsythiae]MBO0951413.1 phospholipase [Fibrella forsythiae]